MQEEYGGTAVAAPVDPARARVALAAVAAGAALAGSAEPPTYARVDLMWWGGAWVVGELELVEPGLFLDVVPEVATALAGALAGVVSPAGGGPTPRGE